jgi:hypothetical protein
MAELTLTIEQLTKIHDMGVRLSRDPVFLAAVENAMKGLLPSVSSATAESSTEVREAVSAGEPRIERTVSFGWSIPLNEDDTVPVATIVAHQVAVFAVAAKAAVAAGVAKE